MEGDASSESARVVQRFHSACARHQLGNLLPRAIRFVATKHAHDCLIIGEDRAICACSRANSSAISPTRPRCMIRAPRRAGRGSPLACHLRLRAFGRKGSPSRRHCPAFASWRWGSRFSQRAPMHNRKTGLPVLPTIPCRHSRLPDCQRRAIARCSLPTVVLPLRLLRRSQPRRRRQRHRRM